MKLSQEHRELIETIIRQTPAFGGREDLMEQICALVYKKSYLLLDSVSNLNNLKNYLTKVAETSIGTVLASQVQQGEHVTEPVFESLNIEQTTQAIVQEPIKPLEDELVSDLDNIKNDDIKSIAPKKRPELKVVNLKDDKQKTQVTQKFTQLIDPIEFYPKKTVNPEIVGDIIPALKVINSKYPNKKFAQIFKMRHVQNMRQAAIARKLKISQSELSRRYSEMVKYLSQAVSKN